MKMKTTTMVKNGPDSFLGKDMSGLPICMAGLVVFHLVDDQFSRFGGYVRGLLCCDYMLGKVMLTCSKLIPFIGNFVFYGDRTETDRFLHFMSKSLAPKNVVLPFYYFVCYEE